YVFEQLNPFSRQRERKERAAGEITARLPEALDDTQCYRVTAEGKQDRNICYRRHRASCRTARHGKVYIAAPQFGYNLAQRLRIARCIVNLKGNVLSLNIASRAQSFAKPIQERVGLRFS